MAKTPTTFRLSDACKDNLQEAVEIRRQLYVLEGRDWMSENCDRTDIIHQAVDYYLSHLQEKKRAYSPKKR